MRIGTVAHLKALLLNEIIPEELAVQRCNQLYQLRRLHLSASFGREQDVGHTCDADAATIASKALFSKEELLAEAQAARERAIEAGIYNYVETQQVYDKDGKPPNFDQSLVGKLLEVCWKYVDKDTGEPALIWSPGRVERVADGLTDTRSARAKKILPAGALLWRWEADKDFDEQAGEAWLILLPNKFNRHVHYGWRYDPSQLVKERAVQFVSFVRDEPCAEEDVTDEMNP